jgi:hypothetical protein
LQVVEDRLLEERPRMVHQSSAKASGRNPPS